MIRNTVFSALKKNVIGKTIADVTISEVEQGWGVDPVLTLAFTDGTTHDITLPENTSVCEPELKDPHGTLIEVDARFVLNRDFGRANAGDGGVVVELDNDDTESVGVRLDGFEGINWVNAEDIIVIRD